MGIENEREEWVEARSSWSISLVDCPFADRHGGECEWYLPVEFDTEDKAIAYALKKTGEYEKLGRPGRFVPRKHDHEAGWVKSFTLVF